MLSCRDLANVVASDYVDGNLGLRARFGVRMHLAMCENCRRFIKQLRQVRTVIRHRFETPPDTVTDIKLQQLAAQLHASAQQQKNSS